MPVGIDRRALAGGIELRHLPGVERPADRAEVLPQLVLVACADDDSVDELELQRLSSITLTSDSASVGQVLGNLIHSLDLDVTVVSVRRAKGAVIEPTEDLVLLEGDTLLLSGRPKELNRASAALLKG